ncbi:hypothetical protein FDUTEX481_05717 [Tolypothrix sp. PCC 7601]|nr:hypothetical protein FDUTEX481_05717 [Tolypothrix sp. PCC 7601]BAY92834.1 hypothetical protein NIES3275_48710 [Microchaete diplosiphon NIES-3275]
MSAEGAEEKEYVPLKLILYFGLVNYLTGLTQNHEKTNHEVRKEHEVKRVWKSYCVSPI